jgi:phosphorylcholine metabolism protein LicD
MDYKLVFFILIILCSFLCSTVDNKEKVYTPQEYDYIHKVLLENLEKTIKIFEKHNIEYWGIFGTLLGSVRENKIIDYDDDIDLGIKKKDYLRLKNEKNIQKDFLNEGLELRVPESNKFRIIKIVSKKTDKNKENNIFIDLMSYEKHGDKYVFSEIDARKRWWKFYLSERELYPLKEGKFNNLNIKIPNKSISYLTRGYGNCSGKKCWKIPDKKPGHHYKEVNINID